MTYYVSNCGQDENGGWHGGAAGDQTGKEYWVRPWYDFRQTMTARHPDANVRATIARLARDAANNPNIGYDQYQRLTMWAQLEKVGYETSKIRVKCEADCSSSTAAIVKATGHLLGIDALTKVSPNMTTWIEEEQLKKAGFKILYSGARNPAGLLAGDIQFNEEHHTNIFLSNETPTPLAIDGAIGPLSVSAWQTQIGGAVDGVISGQNPEYKDNLSALYSVTWTEEGSYLVELVQRKCIRAGFSCGDYGANGILGPDSIKAIQKLLRSWGYEIGPIDGWLGPKTAKGIQRSINDGRWS